MSLSVIFMAMHLAQAFPLRRDTAITGLRHVVQTSLSCLTDVQKRTLTVAPL